MRIAKNIFPFPIQFLFWGNGPGGEGRVGGGSDEDTERQGKGVCENRELEKKYKKNNCLFSNLKKM